MAEAKAVNGEEEQVHIRKYKGKFEIISFLFQVLCKKVELFKINNVYPSSENLDPKIKNVNIKYCPLPGIYDIYLYISDIWLYRILYFLRFR